MRAVDLAVAERRAARGTEVAFGNGRGAERGRLAACPGKILVANISKGRERAGPRPLAHSAVSNADPDRFCIDGKSNGAALASAGERRFSPVRHSSRPDLLVDGAQRRERVAACEDEVVDTGGAEFSLLVAGTASQI